MEGAKHAADDKRQKLDVCARESRTAGVLVTIAIADRICAPAWNASASLSDLGGRPVVEFCRAKSIFRGHIIIHRCGLSEANAEPSVKSRSRTAPWASNRPPVPSGSLSGNNAICPDAKHRVSRAATLRHQMKTDAVVG